MSERRLLQDRVKSADPENNFQSTEAQVRQALEHMGGQRLSLPSGSHGSSSRAGGSPASSRHRYVRDGEVPVVHAALGRAVVRPDTGTQQEKALIESMRQDLDRQRAANEAAERSLHEARASLVTLQTRLAHVEMDLQAAKEAAQEAEQQATEQRAIADAAVAEAAAAQAAVASTPPLLLPVQRKTRVGKVEKAEREPQPVRWWIKAEKA